MYGTRVMPSQAFDVLGKGFSKIQLVLTVVALGIGVTVLAPIVRPLLPILDSTPRSINVLMLILVTGAEKADQYDLEGWFLGVDLQVLYAFYYISGTYDVDVGLNSSIIKSMIRYYDFALCNLTKSI